MKYRRSVLVALSITLVMAACGGGGGGSSGSMSQQKLQSAQAPQQPWSVPATTLTATDSSGNTWTATYSQTPNAGTANFDGQTAFTSNVSLTILENGMTVATEVSTAYYLENPFVALGLSGSTNGQSWVFIYNGTDPLPATLTVGDSGPVGSGTYYDANTMAVLGSLTTTYSVAANDSVSLLLNEYASGSINGNAESETITYTVGASGSVSLSSVQITVGGETLTFT
jgi:hypothetical protein